VLPGGSVGGGIVGHAAAFAANAGGEFARGLAQGRAAALELDRRLRQEQRFAALAAGAPELDIVVWKVNAEDPQRASKMAQQIFAACATRDLHLALVQLPLCWFQLSDFEEKGVEAGPVTCLRSVLMKPEHGAWLDRIWERLTAASVEVGENRGDGEMIDVTKENVLIRKGNCSLTILPRLGGKIASILVNDRELLQGPLAPYGPRSRTMSFDAGDASGWDECLPSVADCTVETEAGPASIPDHGDLWRVAWQNRDQGIANREQVPGDAGASSATFRGECFSLPLVLERTVTLAELDGGAGRGWQVRLDYTVTNTGSYPVPWSWSAHPLFRAEAGDCIVLPGSIETLRVEVPEAAGWGVVANG